jgi:ribosomal protein S18 acetylase RimI-like enzyme
MSIAYKLNAAVSTDQFIDVLRRSTLGKRRPLEDRECMEGMIRNATLTVSAWEGELLVGIARSVTDFHYCCYLSDLAVDVAHQHEGIGRELVKRTQDALGPRCKLLLLSAPAASAYYPKLGFVRNANCWELPPGRSP